MKRILLTGGGTGGHIYPLLAIAEALQKFGGGKAEIFYLGPKNPLNAEFEKLNIKVYRLASSKLRRYFSFANFLDIPKFIYSFFQALTRLYFLMPDIVFSKGGPGAFPAVLAAKFYFIPVFIHESDSAPGLTNRLSAPFAARVFLAFKKAAGVFPAGKTLLVGNPIRAELLVQPIDQKSAKEKLKFKSEEPLVLILGGSQGGQRLNNFVFENLEPFLQVAQIFHQVGEANLAEAKKVASADSGRYQAAGLLEAEDLKTALSASDLVISRAGAGAIFEVAAFGKPTILIPLDGAANDHQKSNAYEYTENARLPDGQGAAVVIEEGNFKFNLVLTQIKNILENREVMEKMSAVAKSFAKIDAAEIIAKEILLPTQK